MSTICRTCLKQTKNESCTYVNLDYTLPESNLTIKEKLLACLPEVSVNIVPNPSICNSCVSALEVTYEFWSLCLRTEEAIRDYMQKNSASNNYIDLNQLVDSEKSLSMENVSNSPECDVVEVECSSPNEMNVEPDLIDIKYVDPSEQTVKEEVDEITEDENTLEYFENYSNQNEEIIEVIIKDESTEENIENQLQEDSHVCYKCGECFTLETSLNSHMNVHLKSNNKWKGPIIKRTTLPLKRLNEHLSRENAKKKPYTCNICGSSFPRKNILKTHMNAHTGERPYKCDICSKQFNFKNNLQRHMVLHGAGNPKRFKCNICDKVFTRKEHLSKHMISHTNDMTYQCTLCKKLFKYKSSLRGHLKYHDGEKRFRCDVCGNGFIRRDNLHVHIRTVHADEKQPIHCGICKKELFEECTCEDRKSLRNAGRMVFKCKTCDKVCRTKQNLRSHSNIHLKEKPYKCNICNSAFAQKGTLTHHIRTHTGEKPFTCFVCERSFTQKATLRNHLQTHRSKSGVLVKDEPAE